MKNVNSKWIRSYYYLMQSLEGIRSVNILRSMYFANFRLHLMYGILFFGGGGGGGGGYKKKKKK